MEENAVPLASDRFSQVVRKLIAETSRAPEGEAGLQKIYHEALCSLDAIGVERASILLFDPDGVMRFKAWLGISDKYRKAVEGHTPWTPNDFNPASLITTDIYLDPELKPYFKTFESEDIRALAFIPLLYRGRVIGKFMLYSRIPYDFSSELDAADTIAQIVAYAVVRKKIEDSLSLSEHRLENLLEKETEARMGAEKSVHQRDEFLSIASHELKTPLTPILMNFQLLKRSLGLLQLNDKEKGILNKVLDSTDKQLDRFLKLIDNLLDVSRITADRLLLEKEHLDLSHLIIDIVEKYRAACITVGCEIVSDIEEGVRGSFDKVRIEQVLTNLLTNAMKYGVGKPIEVKLKADHEKAWIIVKDHGIGIAREHQEMIFNRFERVASADYFGGLGLGLFISSNIVTAHGGKISVESEPGKGSVFTVELPVYSH